MGIERLARLESTHQPQHQDCPSRSCFLDFAFLKSVWQVDQCGEKGGKLGASLIV